PTSSLRASVISAFTRVSRRAMRAHLLSGCAGCSLRSPAQRSVDSRCSHRLRMRCELETLLHTVPLHDPGSEMTTTVAHETHNKTRRTDAVQIVVRGKGEGRR